jgi:hypothetical protein
MRTFLALICTLALACVAGGAQEKNKSKKSAPKKAQAQSSQHAAAAGSGAQKAKGSQHGTKIGGTPVSSGGQKTKGKAAHNASGSYSTRAGSTAGYQKKAKGPQNGTTVGGHPAGTGAQKTKGKTKGSQQIATQQSAYYDAQKTKKTKVSTTSAAAFQSNAKTYKARRFDLQTKVRPTTVAGVTFQQTRRIQGSQNWQGKNYWAFRNYRPAWHERNWWNRNYNRVVFVYGGWYYWNAGWWYPAWGYAPNAYYAYDGPIYGYNGLPPDQVIANVQAALQQQGYYQGAVDGLLGPLTRGAIADYQRDHGLYETASIDQPTLESLGMT